MLDRRFLREHADEAKRRLAQRGTALDLDRVIGLAEELRVQRGALDTLRAERNQMNDEAARLRQKGADAAAAIAAMRALSAKIKALEEETRRLDEAVTAALLELPNLPHASVPAGAADAENREERRWGAPPAFAFTPRDHVDIGEGLGILDFKRAARLAGTRFALTQGAGARLERALINFMLDLHTSEHGYRETFTPFIVNSASLTGTGQLPKFEDDLFKLRDSDYYLIPTAEVPVTNIHREEIIPYEQLPISYAAYSACFRREAGSYGKDTRGLIRQHQFNKVELVKLVDPQTSYDELERLTGHAEAVLRRLGLHYRVVTLCAGDLGFAAAKTYDLEVWFPAQQRFREISSCSNFEDFQARRANIRAKGGPYPKPVFVHTLNGSGLAVGRTFAALLENYQQENGDVLLPAALIPYMGGLERITAAP
ncbi:MAG: serine--tRNA ligase [Candidatus Tectomicrobia bacterium]|nr:serine--tRNA ligase [Candidatus Tectomicrobia bacterium]